MARLLALFSLCFALVGCELVADFDRSKIPLADAGTPPKPDAAVVQPVSDGAVPIADAGNGEQDASASDAAGPRDDDAGN